MPYRKLPSKLYSRVVETVWLMARSNSLKACASMTVGLCFHFLGFECARAASITLLAAKVSIPLNLYGIIPYNDGYSVLQDVGLGNEAIPLTIAIGSPLSGLVLYLYTKSIKKFGSKFTLRVSFLAVIVFMAIITWVTRDLRGLSGKLAVVSFYAFREIYVSLISSQQWAFVAGTLNKSTSSYIVAFSGVVSAASALGGCLIEQLVNYGGVQALLSTALLASIASCLCTEFAYTWSDVLPVPTQSTTQHSDTAHAKSATADHHKAAAVEQKNNSNSGGAVSAGADHSINTSKEQTGLRRRLNSTNTHTFATDVATNHSKTATIAAPVPATSHAVDATKHKKGKSGFWADSWNLIWKHKMLQVLFVEGVLHQLCGNMLNLMFHNGLRLEITSDATRAMLVGRFFATVNITSCALQCFVLPHILSHSSLPTVLAYIPVFVLAASLFGVVYPSLISVMLSFGTIKVLEYSVMHSASEMIYMPLGHEVRYLGKELIRYFSHKLGKSGSSLVLSAMVSQLQPSLAMQSVWGAILTVAWGGSMLTLANSVRERDQQDEKDLQAQRVAAAAAKFRRTSAEIKTRRKARSFSLDDSAIKLSSNSRAVLRVPGGNKTEPAAVQSAATGAAVASGHAPEHSATSALPVRSLSASRDSVPPKWKAPLQEGIRSVSLDHSHEAASGGGDLRAAALRNAFERSEKTVVEELPSDSGTGVVPDATSGRETVQEQPASPAPAVVMSVEGVLQAVLPAPPVPVSLPLPAASPVVAPDPDGLDTITDVSASPEGSLCLSHAERSHAASMDSLNSLTQDFDRTGSFSESIEQHPMYDDGGEDNQPETMYFGKFRPSHASMDSLNSLASGERRLSWERDQRKRELEAQEQQPVMLRVGSVSVSLNSLRATAERQRQGSQDSGSP
jgi:hypothetical protein